MGYRAPPPGGFAADLPSKWGGEADLPSTWGGETYPAYREVGK